MATARPAKRSVRRRLLVFASSLAAAAAFWFLAVHLTWHVEHCPVCLMDRDVVALRVCWIPVRTWKRCHPSGWQKCAETLGVPCEHENLERWLKQCRWGLLVVTGPDAMYHMGEMFWFTGNVARALRVWGTEDPTLAETFRRKVLVERDIEYWRTFSKELCERAERGAARDDPRETNAREH